MISELYVNGANVSFEMVEMPRRGAELNWLVKNLSYL